MNKDMRGLQVIFFLIISLFELHAQLEYTLDGRITPEAFDSLVSSGVISRITSYNVCYTKLLRKCVFLATHILLLLSHGILFYLGKRS